MMKVLSKVCLGALLLIPSALRAADVTITVHNADSIQRQELIELDARQVMQRLGVTDGKSFVVRNLTGQQVDHQITYDGKLLIDAAVKPCGRTVFKVSKGVPEPMRTWVQGKMYSIRKDDLGWENDRGAYRVYGPALQRSGEKSYGIDVWTKNSKELDMSERYYRAIEASVLRQANAGNDSLIREIDLRRSFHLDHGDGLDCYGVGPTLGCGTPALMVDGDLLMPYCYKSYKILDNGPLRFTVELTYNPTKVKNDENVVEHRLISLDKGSNFNKMTVWYEGLSKPCDLAAGVVIHSADTESVVIGKNFVQYADPTDRPEEYGFQLYVAALFPYGADTKKLLLDKPFNGIEGHAIGVKKDLKNNERYTYFFGSAWSKYDVRNQEEWQLRINYFMKSLERPLVPVIN